MAQPPRLSPEDAKEKIFLKIVEGKIEFSFHCLYESMPKRNIDETDILNALETGVIRREPEWAMSIKIGDTGSKASIWKMMN